MDNLTYHLGSSLETPACIVFPINCKVQNKGEKEFTTIHNVGHFSFNNDRTVDVTLPKNIKLTDAEQLFKDIRRQLAGNL